MSLSTPILTLMSCACPGAPAQAAEPRVVGRQLVHLRDHGLAVSGALQCRDGLEIMQRAGIDAGLVHGWDLARGVALGLPALGPGAVGVVHVPVPGFGEDQTLRRV